MPRLSFYPSAIVLGFLFSWSIPLATASTVYLNSELQTRILKKIIELPLFPTEDKAIPAGPDFDLGAKTHMVLSFFPDPESGALDLDFCYRETYLESLPEKRTCRIAEDKNNPHLLSSVRLVSTSYEDRKIQQGIFVVAGYQQNPKNSPVTLQIELDTGYIGNLMFLLELNDLPIPNENQMRTLEGVFQSGQPILGLPKNLPGKLKLRFSFDFNSNYKPIELTRKTWEKRFHIKLGELKSTSTSSNKRYEAEFLIDLDRIDVPVSSEENPDIPAVLKKS